MFEGYRLSPQQRQLWLSGYKNQYAQLVLSIAGPLHKEHLLDALRALIAQHEILRTDFQFTPGMKLPVQVVTESKPLDLIEHDLQPLDEQAQKKEIADALE